MKTFTTTGVCTKENNYMVDITDRLIKMKAMVDAGNYFTVTRGRQYGKTTTLTALAKYLKNEYVVLNLDFQNLDDGSFENGSIFTQALSQLMIDEYEFGGAEIPQNYIEAFEELCQKDTAKVRMADIFRIYKRWCRDSEKPVVLMIDEVDSATNNQVFLDFLALLREGFLARTSKGVPTFRSVILAGVTDIKSLKRKIRPDEAHKFNSPWNIAADFNIDMSLPATGIKGMLDEYENDHHTGMETAKMAQEIYDYTSGYPFLVSRICQIIDTELNLWTVSGVSEAVKRILQEKNTLFDSLMGKVYDNKPLSDILQSILFSGERVAYNPDSIPIMDGEMYGLLKAVDNGLYISNRIFETRIYNYFLTQTELKNSPISISGSESKEMLIENGRLNMDKLLERYVTVFDDIYEGKADTFSEEEGRRRFLLFIRPIINGTGNYYVESRTRNNERMDIVIDYLGERFVVELKIWRGEAYHEKGEQQLANYLDYYHLDRGYMLTYSFNKSKNIALTTKTIQGKTLIEAFV